MILQRLFGKYITKKTGSYTVYLRKGTVDQEVYEYVFSQQYHRPVHLLRDSPVILDLGTNIGLSVVDLKLVYPDARIYGFEMDKNNYEVAQKNCSTIPAVHISNKAIWKSNGMMSYQKAGNDDAYKLDPSVANGKNEISVETITIDKIIAENNIDFVDFVKMDIEGAELEIFEAPLDWLNKVGEIKIEVHYDKSRFDFFIQKLQQYGFTAQVDTHHWSTVIGYRKHES
jgi:FkbM family methyltransferase